MSAPETAGSPLEVAGNGPQASGSPLEVGR
jgi:hypothetical protein